MGRKQLLKRERHGQLRIDWELAQKLEGLFIRPFSTVAIHGILNPQISIS